MKASFQSIEIPDKRNGHSFPGRSERFVYPPANRFIATNLQLIDDLLPYQCPEKDWGSVSKRIPENEEYLKRVYAWYNPTSSTPCLRQRCYSTY